MKYNVTSVTHNYPNEDSQKEEKKKKIPMNILRKKEKKIPMKRTVCLTKKILCVLSLKYVLNG